MERVLAATLILVMSVTFSTTARARVQPREEALPAVLADLRQVVVSVDIPPPARSGLLADVDWFIAESKRSSGAEITPEYIRSFTRVTELLKSRPSPETLADVAAELQAKREHCRALGVGMGGVVKLLVNTRRGSAAAPDWQVLYLLKIYEWVPGAAATNFPRLSTPTELDLEPGRYWVWARDPATGKVSERILVKAAGQRELMVDLSVP